MSRRPSNFNNHPPGLLLLASILIGAGLMILAHLLAQ